ncbi:MAG TPA: menaquinone-dependent protoporphyrinogen IX dehydrogenase [Usitatibacter sp.]
MAHILILYGTFDGQTARIAEHIGAALVRDHHHSVTVRAVEAPEAASEIDRCDAVIVGGAVRYGRFSKTLEAFVRAHGARIAALPNAFFSVCLSARKARDGHALAERYVDGFSARTAWQPRRTADFAGALAYSKYGFFRRLMMRIISLAAGGGTDTSRDYEYTDWHAVDAFAAGFAWKLDVARVA